VSVNGRRGSCWWGCRAVKMATARPLRERGQDGVQPDPTRQHGVRERVGAVQAGPQRPEPTQFVDQIPDQPGPDLRRGDHTFRRQRPSDPAPQDGPVDPPGRQFRIVLQPACHGLTQLWVDRRGTRCVRATDRDTHARLGT